MAAAQLTRSRLQQYYQFEVIYIHVLNCSYLSCLFFSVTCENVPGLPSWLLRARVHGQQLRSQHRFGSASKSLSADLGMSCPHYNPSQLALSSGYG